MTSEPTETRVHARNAARELLNIICTVAAELRFAGELPAPVHVPLLMMPAEQPRTWTELGVLRGVSLPTMSDSIAPRRLAAILPNIGVKRAVYIGDTTRTGHA